MFRKPSQNQTLDGFSDGLWMEQQAKHSFSNTSSASGVCLCHLEKHAVSAQMHLVLHSSSTTPPTEVIQACAVFASSPCVDAKEIVVSLSDSVLHADALCFAAPQGGMASRQMLAVVTSQSTSMLCRRFSVFLNSTETCCAAGSAQGTTSRGNREDAKTSICLFRLESDV